MKYKVTVFKSVSDEDSFDVIHNVIKIELEYGVLLCYCESSTIGYKEYHCFVMEAEE